MRPNRVRTWTGAGLAAFLMFSGSALAQLKRFDNPGALSPQAISVSYSSGHEQPGGFWGLSFRAGGGGSLQWRSAYELFPGNVAILPPVEPSYLINEPPAGETSAGLPLVIDFQNPARRVGLRLASLTPDTASIRAFDFTGALLGQIDGVELAPPEGEELDRFVGVESSGGAGISKLVIDYASGNRELLGPLAFDLVSRPPFRRILPQIGRGDLPGGGRLETTIAVASLYHRPASGTIRLLDDQGRPALVAGQDVVALQTGFGTPQILDTTDVGRERFSGYAIIESNVPVAASATYRAVDAEGVLISEAGVGSTEAGRQLIGVAEELRRQGLAGQFIRVNDLRGAVAIVNPSESPALVKLVYGNFISELFLTPGAHVARFLFHVFPLSEEADFRAQFTLQSNQPVAATLLQTLDGLPQASLPLEVANR